VATTKSVSLNKLQNYIFSKAFRPKRFFLKLLYFSAFFSLRRWSIQLVYWVKSALICHSKVFLRANPKRCESFCTLATGRVERGFCLS